MHAVEVALLSRSVLSHGSAIQLLMLSLLSGLRLQHWFEIWLLSLSNNRHVVALVFEIALLLAEQVLSAVIFLAKFSSSG